MILTGFGALNKLLPKSLFKAPMILTGFGALNKLLGKKVYVSQDQLGGPQIMVPNGVTHQVVRDDQEGMMAIVDWLSFVPKDAFSIGPMPDISGDPWDRDVDCAPTKLPHNPRHWLQGCISSDGELQKGF